MRTSLNPQLASLAISELLIPDHVLAGQAAVAGPAMNPSVSMPRSRTLWPA